MVKIPYEKHEKYRRKSKKFLQRSWKWMYDKKYPLGENRENNRGGTSVKRESFGSRLGFILVSAGCAVGIGNVWRFPYVSGQNGGGVFVLFYLIFLLCMGVPVLTMELAVGRAGRSSSGSCRPRRPS